MADTDGYSHGSGSNNSIKEFTIPDSEQSSPISKDNRHNKTRIFSYRELAIATQDFNFNVCLGRGRFGPVFRGKLIDDEVLAVRKLSPLDLQSEDEFVAQVLLLSQLYNQNLVDFIGYCAEGNNRLLVFKYMPLGSLEHCLHGLPRALSWNTRMKIAAGVARGIDYLNSFTDPSIFAVGDLKLSNIFFDEEFNPKFSDIGLSKVCQVSSSSHEDMSASIYRAPEFASIGQVTSKSFTYSLGVFLLELISGCKAYDDTRGPDKTSLVSWFWKLPKVRVVKDRKLIMEFADPNVNVSIFKLCRLLGLVTMCLRYNSKDRPSIKLMADILDKLVVRK